MQKRRNKCSPPSFGGPKRSLWPLDLLHLGHVGLQLLVLVRLVHINRRERKRKGEVRSGSVTNRSHRSRLGDNIYLAATRLVERNGWFGHEGIGTAVDLRYTNTHCPWARSTERQTRVENVSRRKHTHTTHTHKNSRRWQHEAQTDLTYSEDDEAEALLSGRLRFWEDVSSSA